MRWLISWCLLFGLWILLVTGWSAPEAFAGAVAAAIAVVGTAVVRLRGTTRFSPRWANVLEAWRIPGYVVTGTYEIFKALWVQLSRPEGAPSLLRSVRYEVVGDDPVSAGIRALAVTYTTVTPNFIVLDVVRRRRLLLYHQVLPGEVLEITRRLGAKP